MKIGSENTYYSGILHVFLKSRWISLGLLKDALHDGILENRHDLYHKSAIK